MYLRYLDDVAQRPSIRLEMQIWRILAKYEPYNCKNASSDSCVF